VIAQADCFLCAGLREFVSTTCTVVGANGTERSDPCNLTNQVKGGNFLLMIVFM
jgi:hypothetical protein